MYSFMLVYPRPFVTVVTHFLVPKLTSLSLYYTQSRARKSIFWLSSGTLVWVKSMCTVLLESHFETRKYFPRGWTSVVASNKQGRRDIEIRPMRSMNLSPLWMMMTAIPLCRKSDRGTSLWTGTSELADWIELLFLIDRLFLESSLRLVKTNIVRFASSRIYRDTIRRSIFIYFASSVRSALP
jgi:hypothetical protein